MTSRKGYVVLLVEDDDAHAEIVVRNLRGFLAANRIIRLSDGQAALDYLLGGAFREPDRPRPDLVLLDLRLPKFDGLQVLRELRGNAAAGSIPAVVLTTSAAESNMVQAHELGVRGYLVKPIDAGKCKELMEALGIYWPQPNGLRRTGLE